VLRHYPALLAYYSVDMVSPAIVIAQCADAQWVGFVVRWRQRMRADPRLRRLP